MSNTEEKPIAEDRHGIVDTIKDVAKKAVDATILNTHPTMIDGRIKLDGEFAKDVVNATVLNSNPAGGNIGTY
jgi:hypothetical protein